MLLTKGFAAGLLVCTLSAMVLTVFKAQRPTAYWLLFVQSAMASLQVFILTH